MMQAGRGATMVALVALLAGCGGGGGGSSGTVTTPAPTPTPTSSVTPAPTPTPAVTQPTAGCTLRARQDWAAAQLREWYLFPDTLPASLDPSPYGTLDGYVDALTANARAQGKDRYFTYVTSIKEEDAYYDTGADAGFGFRLGTDSAGQRVFVIEAFEGGASLNAGVDRGAEILAIGTSASNLRTVSQIVQAEGLDGVSDAFGPGTVGTTRYLRVGDASGTRVVALTASSYALVPVSGRYGARIIDDGGTRVGYLNLRSFISTADQQLRDAFASFASAGVTKLIVDLRYNGGGLVSTAELLGDLLGGGRSASDVFSYTTYRPEKASYNSVRYFAAQPQAIAPTKIAFIGSGGTASASELVLNAFIPYLHADVGLIGSNTYGKPVGQIALDLPDCDDRLRVIAFAKENAAHQGSYYSGLASVVEASCQAGDDISHPLGSADETSVRVALDYLAGRSCTPISGGHSAQSLASGKRSLLSPARPRAAQRETPGLF